MSPPFFSSELYFICSTPFCENILFYGDQVEEVDFNRQKDCVSLLYFIGYENLALGSVRPQDFDKLICNKCEKCMGTFSFFHRHQHRIDGANPVLTIRLHMGKFCRGSSK